MRTEHHTEPRRETGPRWRRKLPALVLAGTLFLLSTLLSCDESLPPPEDPLATLVGNLTLLSANGMVNVRNSFPLGGSGVLSIVAMNVHDEVLDDSAAIEVNLEVWLKNRPAIRSVVRFGAAYLITPGFLSRGFLTMRPNVPMTINYPWSHLTEDGSPFWDNVRLTEGFTTLGVQYCQSDTVTLIAQGSLRLFPHIAPIKLPARELRFVYRIYDYFCPLILESP